MPITVFFHFGPLASHSPLLSLEIGRTPLSSGDSLLSFRLMCGSHIGRKAFRCVVYKEGEHSHPSSFWGGVSQTPCITLVSRTAMVAALRLVLYAPRKASAVTGAVRERKIKLWIPIWLLTMEAVLLPLIPPRTACCRIILQDPNKAFFGN